MDFINSLKHKNIAFEKVDEAEAQKIIRQEYSYYRLLEYSGLFPQKSHSDCFIDLEFSQLYYIAKIDEHISHIIMIACLEIEQTIKTILISTLMNLEISESVIKNFFEYDFDYLSSTYTSKNFDILEKSFSYNDFFSLNIESVIDILQFGSIIRFFDFTKENYLEGNYYKCFKTIGKHLNAVNKIRNTVAHNNPLISKITIKQELKSDVVSSFLGQNGIKHKTLQTNMSKKPIYEFCHLLHLYYLIEPHEKITETQNRLNSFINLCQDYVDSFKNNTMLSSVYRFLETVLFTYENYFKKNIDILLF